MTPRRALLLLTVSIASFAAGVVAVFGWAAASYERWREEVLGE